MSTTFSQNLGTNKTLVFDGTVPLSTQDLPGSGNTRQFDVIYPFTTPFLYDPAAGNLLLEAQTSGGSGAALKWDAVTADPSVRTVIAPGSPTASTGEPAETPVHQFTFEVPPLATIRTSQTEVCWNSQSNSTYQVEFRSDLTGNIWNPLGDCIRSTSSSTCIYDQGQATDNPLRVAVVGLVPFAELGGNDRVAARMGELGGKGALADAGRAHDPEEARLRAAVANCAGGTTF